MIVNPFNRNILGNLIIPYHKGITNELNIIRVNPPTANKGSTQNIYTCIV